jgi:UDP-sulfoquinovose synthase
VDPAKKKKVVVFGGDGFCGWPTALHLSDMGHDVVIVDNFSRRAIDIELGCDSLTPIQPMEIRLQAWKEVSGKTIPFYNLDVAEEYAELVQMLKEEKPDTVVHFAEQRAAPYSMRSPKNKRYTVNNNLGGTHNVMCGVVESGLDIHVVHLGTMGVYGYGTSGGEIPEGYLNVILPGGRESTILHPAYPGSIYHATKCLDALLFQFYNKNDGLRCTDLHQGVVWGTNTAQTVKDERLINRFDYDGDYGTVLNRFLMQAALGIPLTIYGTGGQTRAFIHISDTARCIQLAIENPPAAGSPVEILNQVAETRKVRDLAEMIAAKTGAAVSFINNPRNEAAENELEVSNKKFRLLGLDPVTLDERLFEEVTTIAQKYKARAILGKVMPTSYWNKKRTADIEARGDVLSSPDAQQVAAAAAAAAAAAKSKDSWGIKA